jgi:hypothetical protein
MFDWTSTRRRSRSRQVSFLPAADAHAAGMRSRRETEEACGCDAASEQGTPHCGQAVQRRRCAIRGAAANNAFRTWSTFARKEEGRGNRVARLHNATAAQHTRARRSALPTRPCRNRASCDHRWRCALTLRLFSHHLLVPHCISLAEEDRAHMRISAERREAINAPSCRSCSVVRELSLRVS